ncbi:MAG: ATP-binding cassette domain-containing protein [Alphaproteobacteria bacterium]|nr:ATP-binding cassette domain-containing protein [Alphaproteobacteria bacterium]
MLEIKNLNKSFGGKAVLADLNYSFDNGIYGILAPNGAGKTTLLRCITGIYKEGRKTVFYNNDLLVKIKDYNKIIGYLPQHFGLFKNLSVFDALTLIANFKGLDKKSSRDNIYNCLEVVNLSSEVNKKVRALSGGMLRRLGIACALLGDPNVILLDEPTAGLDPEERIRFKNIISSLSKDKTVILSTHIVEDVEALCDEIIIMKKGEIITSGTCEQIRESANGKVFFVPEEILKKGNSKYYVLSKSIMNGTNYVRILSSEFAKPEFAVSPTVEDGYMCIIEND